MIGGLALVDLLRYVLFVMCAYYLSMTVGIGWVHLRIWLGEGHGVKSLHIWTIALSSGLCVVYIAVDQLSRLHHHSLSWRAWVATPAIGIGLFSLRVMLGKATKDYEAWKTQQEALQKEAQVEDRRREQRSRRRRRQNP